MAPDPRREVAVLVGAVVLGMAPWFSATVAAQSMVIEWGASGATALWLTLAVQAGFVVGSVVSAALLLADRWSPRRLAAGCAVLAALATATITLPGMTAAGALACRFIVGAALSGVYPPAIKVAAGWTATRRGLAIGLLVAGVSVGSAVPHLLRIVVPGGAWRMVQQLAAGSALLAALVFAVRVREGPFQSASVPFDPRAVRRIFANRAVLLATGGYLGHMWELYAMWSSIGLFWAAVAHERGFGNAGAAALAFATIGAGGIGCVWAGVVADRIGRSLTTIVAMAVSGGCAAALGGLRAGPLWLLVFVSLIWGVSIVADSAQFSAAVTEWSDREFVGTSVTVQTALGFLLTMVTIRLVPAWSERWGWDYAYAPLAAGPAVGILCMLALWRMERARRGSPPTPSR